MKRVYLDNAGAGMASKQQLEACAQLMKTMPLSNPHSRHSTAQQTFALVENARARTLKLLGTTSDEYYVIFTHNTTHSLKIIAESFQYTQSHNGSVKMGKLEDLASLLYSQ